MHERPLPLLRPPWVIFRRQALEKQLGAIEGRCNEQVRKISQLEAVERQCSEQGRRSQEQARTISQLDASSKATGKQLKDLESRVQQVQDGAKGAIETVAQALDKECTKRQKQEHAELAPVVPILIGRGMEKESQSVLDYLHAECSPDIKQYLNFRLVSAGSSLPQCHSVIHVYQCSTDRFTEGIKEGTLEAVQRAGASIIAVPVRHMTKPGSFVHSLLSTSQVIPVYRN